VGRCDGCDGVDVLDVLLKARRLQEVSLCPLSVLSVSVFCTTGCA
jgi:hypothetical protein